MNCVLYVMEENTRKSYPTFEKAQKRLKIEFAIRGFDYKQANRHWVNGSRLEIVPKETTKIHFVIQGEK